MAKAQGDGNRRPNHPAPNERAVHSSQLIHSWHSDVELFCSGNAGLVVEYYNIM